MLDEDKIKNDLGKMREAYAKASKQLDDIKARQAQIAEKISKHKARNKNLNKPQWEV